MLLQEKKSEQSNDYVQQYSIGHTMQTKQPGLSAGVGNASDVQRYDSRSIHDTRAAWYMIALVVFLRSLH